MNRRMITTKKPFSLCSNAIVNQISNPAIIAAHRMLRILITKSQVFNYILFIEYYVYKNTIPSTITILL